MALKPKNRVNVCGICNKVFFKQCRLTQHYNKHIGVARFICNFCNVGFQLVNNLEIHERRKHPECNFSNQNKRRNTKDIYRRCEMCNKFFALLFEYEQHYISHLINARHECDVCKAKFLDGKQMLDHRNNEHKFGLIEKGYLALKMSGKRFFCDICSLGFYQKLDLQMHYRSHKPQGEHICDVCEQCFVNENLLQQHYLQHIEEYYLLYNIVSSFACNLCKEFCGSEAELLKHRPLCEKDNILTPNVHVISIDEYTSDANDKCTNSEINQDSLLKFTNDVQNFTVPDIKCNKSIFDNDMSSLSDSVDNNEDKINTVESENTYPDVAPISNPTPEISDSTENVSYSEISKTNDVYSAFTNFPSENNVCVYYGDNIVAYDCDVSNCVVYHINEDDIVEHIEVKQADNSNSPQSEKKSNVFETEDSTDNEKNMTMTSNDVKIVTVYVQNHETEVSPDNGTEIHTFVPRAEDSVLHQNVITYDSETLDTNPNGLENSSEILPCHETNSYIAESLIRGENNDDNELNSKPRMKRKMYKCDVCNKAVSTKAILKTHREAHVGIGTHVCPICKRIYASKTSLRVHKQNHSEKVYTCSFCHKSYHHRYILLIHERNKHGKSKPHKCHACGKGFATRQNLKRHLIMHTGEKPFACDKCSKQYTTKVGLQMHYSIHVSSETYTCEVCGRKFISDLKMKRHYKSHFKKNKGMCRCEICKVGFNDEASLAEHVLCHADEKIHICDICQQGYSSVELLENHKETNHKN